VISSPLYHFIWFTEMGLHWHRRSLY